MKISRKIVTIAFWTIIVAICVYFIYDATIKNNTPKNSDVLSQKQYVYFKLQGIGSGPLQRREIINGGSLNLTIPPVTKFVISFSAEKDLPYTWNITNKLDKNILLMTSRTWMKTLESQKDETQVGKHNFSFISLNPGKQTLEMKFYNPKSPESQVFTTTLNITVDKPAFMK